MAFRPHGLLVVVIFMAQAANAAQGKHKESLSDKVNRDMSLKEQMTLTLSLSMPSIMAQFSSICMQYIDAAMVGSLGATASASIGLMAAPVWLFSGICISACSGFSVQVAHLLGAREAVNARVVVRQAYVVQLLFAAVIAVIACSLSDFLPVFLGGSPEIIDNAGSYFFIFMSALPFFMLNYLSSAMLRCSGNMLLPSLLNILMCLLDVVFNFIFIFPSRTATYPIIGEVEVFGFGYGVIGAALGTVCAAAIELPDGRIVTAHNSITLHACSALLLNALKAMTGIAKEKDLISSSVIKSITAMKRDILSGKGVSMNLDEILIALAMSASEDEDAKKAIEALPLLKNAEVHLTHVPSNGDISGLRKLGLIYTSEPVYPERNTGKKV